MGLANNGGEADDAELGDETDGEGDSYFEEIEMSSYLRAFKALSATDTLYQLLHAHILTKQMDLVTKEAYQVKGKPSGQLLPIQFFIKAVKERILHGSLKNLIALTTEREGENYVSGY